MVESNNYPTADFDIGYQMGTIMWRCCTMALRADQHLTHYSAHMTHDQFHVMAVIQLIPANVAVMTVLYE